MTTLEQIAQLTGDCRQHGTVLRDVAGISVMAQQDRIGRVVLFHKGRKISRARLILMTRGIVK